MKRYRCFFNYAFTLLAFTFSAFLSQAQWTNVGGNVSHNNTYPQHYSFTIDSSGALYVAFADLGNTYVITVKKLVNGAWADVGTPGFITGSGLFYGPGTSIAINPVDQSPYIALADDDHNNSVSVMRFNGSSWQYVGAAGFSPPGACDIKLAFTNAGTPYVAFNDCFNGGTSVMLYNGNWQVAGTAGFANGNYLQLSAAPANTVSIAFKDAAQNGKMSVMSLAGNVWSYNGTPGFSDGVVEHTAFLSDAAGNLYVAYSDDALNNKIIVKAKMGASSWATLGNASFSNGTAHYTDISINRDGVPYVSFVDGIVPVAKKLYNGTWTGLGNNIISANCLHTSLVNDSLGNPNVLMALQPFSTLPFVYKYSPCNDTNYHFEGTALVDSAFSFEGDSTTVTVTASGGTGPYIGTGSFTVYSGGTYYFTITDRSGCSTIATVFVPYPPCSDNYWTGYSSSDWEDAANWSCGTVPAAVTVVHIEAGSTNYPVITSVVTCKQLIVDAGVTITVANGGQLKVVKQ